MSDDFGRGRPENSGGCCGSCFAVLFVLFLTVLGGVVSLGVGVLGSTRDTPQVSPRPSPEPAPARPPKKRKHR